MAPQKRNRRPDDKDEVIAVEAMSSSLHQDGQRKKVRLSNPGSTKSRATHDRASSDSSNDDSDEDIADAVDEDDHNIQPPATQYEYYRDGNFDHLKDTKRDDERATQALRATIERTKQIGQNHAANNAIIQEITCINFMCHKKLHVELGPLINFVVGHNGSGKSAVLTAITLCLGGKAAATNRGASLKSLIKEGEDTGLLIIRLKNEGNDAYQRDVYGDSIIIERQFSRTGTSGFKVKTALGRTISNKKGDVDDIVEYYQLQVDNPMNVLTQDAAKSFITASTPAQKYKFFKDGVQLSALDTDYNHLCNTCDQIEARFKESKDDLEILRKEADVAKRRHQMLEENKDMRKRKREMGGQLAWAQVHDVELALEKRIAHVAEIQQEIDEAETIFNDKDVAFQGFENTLERAKEARKQLIEDMAPVKADEEAAKEAFDEAVVAVKSNRTDRATMKENVARAKQKVAKCTRDIEIENTRLEAANGGANARKVAEIEEARQKVIEARSALTNYTSELPSLRAKTDDIKQQINRIEGLYGNKRKDVEAAERQLASLNQTRSDQMAGFDPKMPGLLRAIRENSGFREKPVGPIGLHIKLKDAKWSNVLESVLNSVLTSFLVTNKADQARLSDLLVRHNMAHFCGVSIVNRNPIDTSGHEPDPQFQTVLGVLDIDNDLVRNYLIINNAMEQAILIEDRKQAMDVMYSGPRPANARYCLCIHDNKPGYGIRLGFSGPGSGNRDMGPVSPQARRPRMNTDIESQIGLQREMVNQFRQELKRLEQAKTEAIGSIKQCNLAVAQHEREKARLNRLLQSAEEMVDLLTTELDDNRPQDGRLDALKDFLVDAEKDLEIIGESYGNLGLEVESLNAQASTKKQELKAVRDRLAEHETMLHKCEEKIRRTESGRLHALTAKNQIVARLQALQEVVKPQAEVKRDEENDKLVHYTSEATKVCPIRVSIPDGETGESLAVKYGKLQDSLKAFDKRMGATPEAINEEFMRTKARFEKAYTERKGLEVILSQLKKAFSMRIDMFRAFQRHISARSRINFAYLLSERAFRGKLTIDHIAKKLDVHVEPDETRKNGKGRSTKTLSGGEKSFSSICLLLSLWEAMGAPLRCLDEFDVFMDDVNRDISTKMIISAARKSVGRQFILITPKALGSGVADGAEDVKIIKLFDPREKQRRITDMMED